jgi:hypothetical protein
MAKTEPDKAAGLIGGATTTIGGGGTAWPRALSVSDTAAKIRRTVKIDKEDLKDLAIGNIQIYWKVHYFNETQHCRSAPCCRQKKPGPKARFPVFGEMSR